MRFVFGFLPLFALVACATGPAVSSSVGDDAVVEPQDIPFELVIGAERWGVMIDRARELARDVEGGVVDESDALRADMALKGGALELLALRNEMCVRGLADGALCVFGYWPAWTVDAPSSDVSVGELRARSDWLGAASGALVQQACEMAIAGGAHEMVCSVE